MHKQGLIVGISMNNEFDGQNLKNECFVDYALAISLPETPAGSNGEDDSF